MRSVSKFSRLIPNALDPLTRTSRCGREKFENNKKCKCNEEETGKVAGSWFKMSVEEAELDESGGEEDEGEIIDWQLPLCFMKKRHRERIEGALPLAQTWRMKERVCPYVFCFRFDVIFVIKYIYKYSL